MEPTALLHLACKANAQQMTQKPLIRDISEEAAFNVDLITLGGTDAETVADRMLWGLVGETISLTEKSADEVAALRDVLLESIDDPAETEDETTVLTGESNVNGDSAHALDEPTLVDTRTNGSADGCTTSNSEALEFELELTAEPPADLLACI